MIVMKIWKSTIITLNSMGKSLTHTKAIPNSPQNCPKYLCNDLKKQLQLNFLLPHSFFKITEFAGGTGQDCSLLPVSEVFYYILHK